jgi:Protein of unknown function (DUF3667).
MSVTESTTTENATHLPSEAPAPPKAGPRLRFRRPPKPRPAPPEFCLNCGMHVPPHFRFCGGCGQENEPSAVSFKELAREAYEEFVHLDVRLLRTLTALLFRPGFLTREYIQGKRLLYLSPFKMYLTVSALFLFVLFQQLQVEDRLQYIQRKMDAGSEAAAASSPPPKSPTQKQEPAQTGMSAEKKAAKAAPETLNIFPGVQVQLRPDKTNAKPQGLAELLPFDGPIYFGGTRVDPNELPETITEYRTAQSQLGPEKRDRLFIRFLKERMIPIKREPAQAINHLLSSLLPATMFFLLPFCALLMRVVYLRSGRLYTEHLVFALHTHSFLFLLLTLDALLPGLQVTLPVTLVVFPVYGLIAMRRFYEQSWPKTLFKALLLFNGYLFLLGFAVIGAFLVSLLSLFLGLGS